MVVRSGEKHKYNKLEVIRLLYLLKGRQEGRGNEKGNDLCKGFNGDAGGERLT